MITVDARGPTPDLAAAVAALVQDRLVVFPTETFYGLGACATSARAVAAVAACKGRDADKPIAVIAADVAMVDQVVARVPPAASVLMRRFWPGPLTLVLPARPDLPRELTAGSGLIGVRVASHPVPCALARAIGAPITATSANAAGAPPPVEVAAAVDTFGDAVAVYLDGGIVTGGSPSTVLLVGEDAVRVIRGGAVSVEALADVLGGTPPVMDG
jgi:L-threonylcarbamoyladenylate synthase